MTNDLTALDRSLWALWKTRSGRFPSSGGRGLGVHGCGSVHRLSGVGIATEAVGAAVNRVVPIEVLANDNPESDATAAPRLRRDLQHPAPEGDRVIARDHPLLLETQNVLEIGRAEGDERARGIARRSRKQGVMLRHELVGQVVVRRAQRRDLGHAEFVDQAILKGAIEPLTAPPRLGRIRRDVLDPSWASARPTWVKRVLSTGPLAFGV